MTFRKLLYVCVHQYIIIDSQGLTIYYDPKRAESATWFVFAWHLKYILRINTYLL